MEVTVVEAVVAEDEAEASEEAVVDEVAVEVVSVAEVR